MFLSKTERRILILLAAGAGLNAAELKTETIQAWNHYIAAFQSQLSVRVQPNEPFLRTASTPDALRSIHAGKTVVAPVGENPKRIPGGLIHHWSGDAFMPNTTIDEVFTVIRDYPRFKEYYSPLVIDSKGLGQVGDEYRFSMLMMNQSLFSKSALDGEYAESFVRVSDTRWYSACYSTRLQQVDDIGRETEHRLPLDEGSGYIWRIYTISRFEQRDSGVYIELEVVALSRDIPVSLRWVVDPIVRRVARNSLQSSLEKTRAAVSSEMVTASRRSEGTLMAHVAQQGADKRR